MKKKRTIKVIHSSEARRSRLTLGEHVARLGARFGLGGRKRLSPTTAHRLDFWINVLDEHSNVYAIVHAVMLVCGGRFGVIHLESPEFENGPVQIWFSLDGAAAPRATHLLPEPVRSPYLDDLFPGTKIT
ncbi:MAG: hypothetical protein AAB923_02875 [Patescibacteria group bacterium]